MSSSECSKLSGRLSQRHVLALIICVSVKVAAPHVEWKQTLDDILEAGERPIRLEVLQTEGVHIHELCVLDA